MFQTHAPSLSTTGPATTAPFGSSAPCRVRQVWVRGGWPEKPVAVKVTGWQTKGLAGDPVTLPIWGAGSGTVRIWFAGVASSPAPFPVWSETVFCPTVLNLMRGLWLVRLEFGGSGVPSWNDQSQELGLPVEVSEKVTSVFGYTCDGLQLKLELGGVCPPPVHSWMSNSEAAAR